MASKQSSGSRVMRYDPARRDMWLHDLRAKVRRESLFGEQMLAGVHQPSAEMQRLNGTMGAEPFRVERLAHSTLQLEGSSSESTASEEEPRLSDRDWRALQEALVGAVESIIVPSEDRGEEKRRTSAPEGEAARASARAEGGPRTPGAEVAAGGLAATAEPSADVRRQDTPPAQVKSISYSELPTQQAPREVARSAAASLPEGAEEEEGEISLHFSTTPGDMPYADGPDRRETLASRMSTLMKGLRAVRLAGMSDTPEAPETKGAEGAPAPPQPSGEPEPGDGPPPQSPPSQVGRALVLTQIGAEDAAQAVRRELESSMQAWQQRRAEQSRQMGPRHRRSPRRRRRTKTFGERYLKKMKLVSTLSKQGMSPEAYQQLPPDMRVAVWQHSNEIIYQLIVDSLGHKYRHLMGRVAEGDGLGAYNAILLLDNEHTAGAKNMYLSELMGLRMEDTGTSANPACILTYYERLHELNAKYSRANDGVGVSTDILRTKLMELPESYSFAVHCMEQDDLAAKRDGREPMTCQAIVDYVRFFENSVRRKAKANRRRPGGSSKLRPKLRPRGKAYWADGKGPRNAGRKPNGGGGNPLRNMRGRAARMAQQRARGGKKTPNAKSKVRCYACGELGHYKRECPNTKGPQASSQPMRRAYNATAQKYKQAPGGKREHKKLDHVSFVLRVVPSEVDSPPRALSAQGANRSLVLDSGATGHFVPTNAPLTGTRPTAKSVAGAGGDVMRGVDEGNLGPLRNVLRVEGLHQGLVSVCQLAHAHGVCVVFSKGHAHLLPQRLLQRFLRGTPPVAKFQRETGLYHTTPERIDAALKAACESPLAKRVLHKEGSAKDRPGTRLSANMAGTKKRSAGGKAGGAIALAAIAPAEMGGHAAPSASKEGSANPQGDAIQRRGAGRPSLKRTASAPPKQMWKMSRDPFAVSAPGGRPSLRRSKTYTGHGPDVKRQKVVTFGWAGADPKLTASRWTLSIPLALTVAGSENEGRGWSRESLAGGAQMMRRLRNDTQGTSTADTRRQVLILASTGDMALARIAADAYKVDWQGIVEEVRANKSRYRHLAAFSTLLTCNKCLLPSWPDCACEPNGFKAGSEPLVRSCQMGRAYNYMDKPLGENPAMVFHRRMGHLSKGRLIQAFKEGGNHGIEGLTLESIQKLPWCPDCAACRQTRRGHPRKAKDRKRANKINECIHTDTMERTILGMAPQRFNRIQVFVDEYSRWMWVRFTRSKSAEEFTRMLENFERAAQIQHRGSCQHQGGQGCPVLAYFSDNASELISRHQKRRLADSLIELRLSTPGESQANGIAERANRLVLDTTRVLLYQAGLPLPFWPAAAEFAVYVLNRSPSQANPQNKSPYEMYYGKPPDRSKIRRFGCKCWVWEDKGSRPHRSKLDPTARPMIFMGYHEHGTQGMKVYDPGRQTIKIRYSLLFAEDENVTLLHVPSDTVRRAAVHEAAQKKIVEPSTRLDIDPADGDDGWSRVYTMSDEETLADVGRRIGVDPHDIQAKNVGLAGAHSKTGLVPIEAPLAEGTEIWIPTRCDVDGANNQSDDVGKGRHESDEVGDAPDEVGDAPDEVGEGVRLESDEVGAVGDASDEVGKLRIEDTTADERTAAEALSRMNETTESKASEETSWAGRLRTRRRKALTVEYDKPIEIVGEGDVGTTFTPKGKHRAMLLSTQRDIEDLLKGDDDVAALKMMIGVAEQEISQEISGPNDEAPVEDLVESAQLASSRGGLEKAYLNGWLYANSAKSAAKHDRTDCLSWILDHGVNVDTSTKSGNTLLHLAAYHGNKATCQMLLARGSEPSAINRRGEEPWEAAAANCHHQCAKLIKAWPNLDEEQLDDLEVDAPLEGEMESKDGGSMLVLTGKEQEHLEDAATRPVELAAQPDTSGLLQRVLERAKTAIQMQATQSLQGEERAAVDRLCDEAHEDFARAYMIERMLLVESLKGTAARDIPTPKNFKEAVNSEFADYWNAAIATEIRNLESFNTWEWVPRPKDRKLIDSCWAFRVKANQKGEVDRMKARLCARGYREIWGQDYVETHAPVTCLASWRACLAQAAHHGRKIAILDIKSAYLMADVKEDIYLSPPEGLKVPDNKKGWVLKLKRSLYGLKQAGRCWSQLLNEKMLELGMRPSTADPCLFLNDEDGELMTVNVHVDDCMITYTDERKYQRFRKRLESMFQISKSDDNNTFLGVVIERLPNGKEDGRGPIYVHQKPYITDILARFRHTDCKPASVPAEPGLKLSKAQMPTTDEEKAAMKDVPYRQLVGALLYLANCTRPDIAQAVSSCARFGSNPGPVHWKALKQVLRYLKGTQSLGLVYGKIFAEGIPHTCIHGYVDGDWGGDADDRRSTTGYVFMSYGGPVSWRSKKQASTALSSCESEYMAASEAAKEAIWLTRLYKEDLKIEDVSLETRGDLTEKEYLGAKPLTVFEDNVGCISLSKNPVMHKSSKHIEIRYHFVRERVQDGSLKLVYIPSSENVADILTKSTRKHTFIYLRNKIMSDPRRIVAPSID